MKIRNRFAVAALGGAGLLTVAVSQAIAEENDGYSGVVWLGVGSLSDDAYRLGRFSGLSEGLFLDLGASVGSRTAHDAEVPGYWQFEAHNLGLDSQGVRIDRGSQGRYDAYVYYQGLPSLAYPGVSTPYRGDGTRDLTLPDEGGRGTLSEHQREIDVGTLRHRVGFGGRRTVAPQWRVSTAVHHEVKEGSRLLGVGEHWGVQRAAVVPAAVDYETTRFEVDAAYDGPRLQGRLGYQISLFSQRGDDIQNVDNVHAANWGDDDTVRQMSLEPDNQFHQVFANLGYNLGQVTRVGADVLVGRMSQDERFIEDHPDLTRTSLEGQINTTRYNLRASTRLGQLGLRANYLYDDRDNRTPQMTIDGFDTNPVSYTQTRLTAEADMRVLNRTHLTLAFIDDERDRTYSDRAVTEETGYEVRLRSRVRRGINVGVNASATEQRGSTWESDITPEALRKYYLADRDRTTVGLLLSMVPVERVHATLRTQLMDDDYLNSELGLLSASRALWSMDLAYVPSDRLRAFAFYSYEQRTAEQAGVDEGAVWRAERDDQAFSLGLGGEFALVQKVLSVGLEGVYMETTGHIDIVDDQAYPALRSKLQTVSLYGDWTINPRMSLRMRYMVEQYSEEDWGLAEVAGIVAASRDAPDYTAHIVAGTIAYRF